MFGRRRPASSTPPQQREETVLIATELRLLARRLDRVADDLATVHGIEDTLGENRRHHE